MNAFKMLGAIALFISTSGCVSLTPKDTSAIKSQEQTILFYALGDRLAIEHTGFTVFGNERTELDISSWKIPEEFAKSIESFTGSKTEYVELYSLTDAHYNWDPLLAYMKQKNVHYAFLLKPADAAGNTTKYDTGLIVNTIWAQGDDTASVLLFGFLGILKADGTYLSTGRSITGFKRIPFSKPKEGAFTLQDAESIRDTVESLAVNAFTSRVSTIFSKTSEQ